MQETKVQSILRQIEETNEYLKVAREEVYELTQRLEAFECLLKETVEKESHINLTDSEF